MVFHPRKIQKKTGVPKTRKKKRFAFLRNASGRSGESKKANLSPSPRGLQTKWIWIREFSSPSSIVYVGGGFNFFDPLSAEMSNFA